MSEPSQTVCGREFSLCEPGPAGRITYLGKSFARKPRARYIVKGINHPGGDPMSNNILEYIEICPCWSRKICHNTV